MYYSAKIKTQDKEKYFILPMSLRVTKYNGGGYKPNNYRVYFN